MPLIKEPEPIEFKDNLAWLKAKGFYEERENEEERILHLKTDYGILEMTLNMEKETVSAVLYWKDKLPHWQEIQELMKEYDEKLDNYLKKHNLEIRKIERLFHHNLSKLDKKFEVSVNHWDKLIDIVDNTTSKIEGNTHVYACFNVIPMYKIKIQDEELTAEEVYKRIENAVEAVEEKYADMNSCGH